MAAINGTWLIPVAKQSVEWQSCKTNNSMSLSAPVLCLTGFHFSPRCITLARTPDTQSVKLAEQGLVLLPFKSRPELFQFPAEARSRHVLELTAAQWGSQAAMPWNRSAVSYSSPILPALVLGLSIQNPMTTNDFHCLFSRIYFLENKTKKNRGKIPSIISSWNTHIQKTTYWFSCSRCLSILAKHCV